METSVGVEVPPMDTVRALDPQPQSKPVRPSTVRAAAIHLRTGDDARRKAEEDFMRHIPGHYGSKLLICPPSPAATAPPAEDTERCGFEASLLPDNTTNYDARNGGLLLARVAVLPRGGGLKLSLNFWRLGPPRCWPRLCGFRGGVALRTVPGARPTLVQRRGAVEGRTGRMSEGPVTRCRSGPAFRRAKQACCRRRPMRARVTDRLRAQRWL